MYKVKLFYEFGPEMFTKYLFKTIFLLCIIKSAVTLQHVASAYDHTLAYADIGC